MLCVTRDCNKDSTIASYCCFQAVHSILFYSSWLVDTAVKNNEQYFMLQQLGSFTPLRRVPQPAEERTIRLCGFHSPRPPHLPKDHQWSTTFYRKTTMYISSLILFSSIYLPVDSLPFLSLPPLLHKSDMKFFLFSFVKMMNSYPPPPLNSDVYLYVIFVHTLCMSDVTLQCLYDHK